MTVAMILEVSAAIIASLGGSALILLTLANYLGKIWAERLMQTERRKHEVELEALRESLRLTSEQQLSSLQAQLDVAIHARIDEHSGRVNAYKGVIDMLSPMITKIEMMLLDRRGQLTTIEHEEFERQRLKAYAYLAMHAPQTVMDAHDRMLDLLLDVIHDGEKVEWQVVRALSIDLLNAIRADLGIRTEAIAYNGRR